MNYLRDKVFMSESDIYQAIQEIFSSKRSRVRKAVYKLAEQSQGNEQELLQEEVIQQLLSFVDDEDKQIRLSVLSLIQKFNLSEGLEEVLKLVKKDSSLFVREQAIKTIGKISDQDAPKEVLNTLTTILTVSKEPTLRSAAAKALADIGNKSIVKSLITSLASDLDCSVRDNAAEALGNLSDKRATNPLIYAIKHDSEFVVRISAIVALGKIGTSKAIDVLLDILKTDENFSNRGAACAGLAHSLDPRAIDPLITVLHSDQHAVPRRAAALALGELYLTFQEEKIIDALKGCVKKEKDDSVVHNANFSLEKIRKQKSKMKLEKE
ncbi:MAG: hypothetical protein GF308_07860 [Candidatus Heimdallarchaeota archaeon]|nr:hypothetical protein [Candidatus Heimdallarchaeota archaeon]